MKSPPRKILRTTSAVCTGVVVDDIVRPQQHLDPRAVCTDRAFGIARGRDVATEFAMDASTRFLGSAPLDVFRRVHLPLLAPSVLTAGLLVFVDVTKELPVTLVLRPFNFDTLAVIAYHLAADERLREAALPS